MRDYLTNLAARSLDATPAIQPRLTSLFEPVPDFSVMFPESSGLVAERLAGFEGVGTDDVVTDRRANNLLIEPPTSSRQATLSRVVDDVHPEHVGAPAPQLSEPERPSVSTPIKPAMQRSPIRETTANEIGNRESTVSHAATPPEKAGPAIAGPGIAFSSAQARAHRDGTTSAESARLAAKAEIDIHAIGDIREASRPALEPQQHMPIEPRLPEAWNEPRADSKPRPSVPTDQPQQERQSTSRLVVPRIEIEGTRARQNQPPTASARESPGPEVGNVTKSSTATMDSPMGTRARRPAELDTEPVRADAAVEPVINVTIGRVEVRAELPTTTSQRVRSSTTSSSLMSLDDYLRQRAQGGKR